MACPRIQIVSCPVEQARCFRQFDIPLPDKICTNKGMRKILLTNRPVLELRLWKDTIDHTHYSLCPYTLNRLVHPLLKHILYQAMYAYATSLRMTPDKREMRKIIQCSIQSKRISGNRLQHRAQIRYACLQDLFRYTVRIKKSTKLKQFSGCPVKTLDLLETQSKGRHNRLRMIPLPFPVALAVANAALYTS